jgi:2-desacetyl-2-hydroxyethyl bacteriochlorophyllide A dehydrogenase
MLGKMDGLFYESKEKVTFEKTEIPVIKDGEALVKVYYSGICGTDMLIYKGKHPRVKDKRILGHEFVGEIVEIQEPNPYDLKIGDNVVADPLLSCGKCYPCQTGNYHVCETLGLLGIDTAGSFAEYIAVSLDKLYKVSNNISMKAAALVEPLAVAVHAVRSSDLKIGDNVVVFGGGPIGILTAYVARSAGANVLVAEIKQWRINLLQKAGFQVVDISKNNIKEEVYKFTNNIGADLVFECAGVPQAINDSLNIVKVKGQVTLVALHKDLAPADLQKIVFKEILLIGVRVYSFRDVIAAIELLEKNEIDTNIVISHILPLSEGTKGFELMASGEKAMKILFYPGEEAK